MGQRTKLTLSKTATQKLLRAIREFNLIQASDRVLVGFSGGKDSAFLLYALTILQRNGIIPFELGALTVDLGFTGSFHFESLKDYCALLEVPFYLLKTEIAKYALAENNPTSPCATCSFLRRGAINRFAKENHYNRVALAHHQDDAVETFLMSILYSGQIQTFLPRTELQKTGLTAIRPLVYFREAEIIEMIPLTRFKPEPSPCPMAGHTKRAVTKDLIHTLCLEDKRVFDHLAAAIRDGRRQELWPAERPKNPRL
jgi:Predicted ATPase of the PP-loop superfamily implicated in cell cycle control